MRLSEERRYQIERAKDRTPTTSAFIWFPVVFVIIAMLTKVKALPEITVNLMPVHETVLSQEAPRNYRNGDLVCHGDRWCFLSWRL
jgi:hypothetical protein